VASSYLAYEIQDVNNNLNRAISTGNSIAYEGTCENIFVLSTFSSQNLLPDAIIRAVEKTYIYLFASGQRYRC
jgi:hypothetical protein